MIIITKYKKLNNNLNITLILKINIFSTFKSKLIKKFFEGKILFERKIK